MMQYDRLLSLIDAELHLLRRVRELISVFDTDPPSGRMKKEKSKSPRGKKSLPRIRRLAVETPIDEASTSVPQGPGLQADALAIKRTKRLPGREKPGAYKKTSAAGPVKPLGGAIPEGPVFVPAKEIRQAQTERQRGLTPDLRSSDAAYVDPQTAELLRQKWLQDLV